MATELAKELNPSLEGYVLNNRYMVERLVSRGGMGTVYQGTHNLIGKKVAIKVLNSDLAFREDIVTRFYREAQAAAVIGHRNIVDVLDVGLINDSQPYLVMEYLEGECLLKMMEREGTLNLSAATAIMEPLLQALSASHEKGVVHRDLKPDNIFIGMEGQNDLVVKIIDFGISKFAHTLRNQRLTMAGAAVGTPPYMSPEQARGEDDVDFRADIYSAGIIFYEMLVGKLPFVGVTVREILAKVINDPPTPPKSINPDFPEAATPILEKALAKDPEERYQSAEAMLADIRRLEGYNDRYLSLAVVAAGITQLSCAGVETPTDRMPAFPSTIAPDPLSLFATQETASISGPVKSSKNPLRVVKGFLAAVGAGVLVLAGILYGLGFNFSSVLTAVDSAPKMDSKIKTAEFNIASPLKTKKDEKITISVTGVPKNAAIFFDGARRTPPSFETIPQESPKLLRVELDGFEPFEVKLTPQKDTIVEARLLPVPQSSSPSDWEKKDKTSRNNLKNNSKSSRNQLNSEKRAQATLKYGRNGATIADDFE